MSTTVFDFEKYDDNHSKIWHAFVSLSLSRDEKDRRMVIKNVILDIIDGDSENSLYETSKTIYFKGR